KPAVDGITVTSSVHRTFVVRLFNERIGTFEAPLVQIIYVVPGVGLHWIAQNSHALRQSRHHLKVPLERGYIVRRTKQLTLHPNSVTRCLCEEAAVQGTTSEHVLAHVLDIAVLHR